MFKIYIIAECAIKLTE